MLAWLQIDAMKRKTSAKQNPLAILYLGDNNEKLYYADHKKNIIPIINDHSFFNNYGYIFGVIIMM